MLTFQNKKLTAPGIPKPSPIQVLTGPNVAWLARSNGMAYFQRGMVVSDAVGYLFLEIQAVPALKCLSNLDFQVSFSYFTPFTCISFVFEQPGTALKWYIAILTNNQAGIQCGRSAAIVVTAKNAKFWKILSNIRENSWKFWKIPFRTFQKFLENSRKFWKILCRTF